MTGIRGLPRFVLTFLKLHRRRLTKRGGGLKPLLPLDTPLQVMIDPSNVCNFRCIFCPTGDMELLKQVNRPRGLMDFSLFTKLIDDLAQFPKKIEDVCLYKDGEPLLNNAVGDMIAYAREKEVAHRIIMTSNCALLDEKKADALIRGGLDVLRVSVEHVSDEGYKNVTKTFGQYQAILTNVGFLYHEKRRRGSSLHIHAKIIDAGLTTAQKRKFYGDFSGISDSIAIESIMGWSNPLDRNFMLGLDPDAGMTGIAPRKRDRKVCPSPFHQMSVNWTGQVSVCCVDWSMDTIVGDASRQSLREIWNSPVFDKFRLEHLKGNKDRLRACHNCQFIQGFMPSDDLDDADHELMQYYPDRMGGDTETLSEAMSSLRNARFVKD